MLNRIVVINSELYAKAAISIGDSNSIQLAAENNVGKSSFLNTLNFLYIVDKEQMRFEDNRKLSESMKHYFGGTSIYSFIIFEIFSNGYYCILVKATPENTLEYYKISGEYKENFFVEKLPDGGFKPKKWETALQELTNDNPTDAPIQLKSDDLYNLIYNSDKNKNPVVLINSKVKRKGKSLSNSFTEIYKHLIKTSEITEKSFKNALLVADNKQNEPLSIFSNDKLEKIGDFERKKTHLNKLHSVKKDFEILKLLNDEFIAKETVLGKLKHTFFSKYNEIAKELSDKIDENSTLSQEINSLDAKINKTFKAERDKLIAEKTTAENKLKFNKIEIGIDEDTDNKTKLEKSPKLWELLKEVENYEPTNEDLLFQGLLSEVEITDKKRQELEAQLTQSERSSFTSQQVEKQITELEAEIKAIDNSISEFDNLLYQNISDDPEITKQVYSYLHSNIANLDKSNIVNKITKADFPMTFFDGKIDVNEVTIKTPETINELKEKVEIKNKDLNEKILLLDAIKNSNALQKELTNLKTEISKKNTLIEKITNKPNLLVQKNQIEADIQELEEITIPAINKKIENEDTEIETAKKLFEVKKAEKAKHESDLNDYKKQYSYFGNNDIYEIEEILERPFEKIHEEFTKTYYAFAIGEECLKARRQKRKDSICRTLDSDKNNIKDFIKEVDEELLNLPDSQRTLDALLNSLSIEIGNPTANFLQKYNDFKTFVYHNYNRNLANYPISNIQEVKVKIDDNEELIKDLTSISKLKFSDGLDFDNAYLESKKALEKQLLEHKGKSISIEDLFSINVEITKVTGEKEDIDLSKQVQSKGTNIVLKLYLFLNILKDLVQQINSNKIIIYVDELDSIGQKNVKHLVSFCKEHNFVPLFAAPRKVEGIEKYYMIKEQKPKIIFGELQSFPVIYRKENAEHNV